MVRFPEEWKGVGVDSTPDGLQDMISLSEQGLISSLAEVKSKGCCPFRSVFARLMATSVRMIQMLSGELRGGSSGSAMRTRMCLWSGRGAVVLTHTWGMSGLSRTSRANRGGWRRMLRMHWVMYGM